MSIRHLINYTPTSNLNIESINVNGSTIINGNLQVNGSSNISPDSDNIIANSIQFQGENQSILNKYNIYNYISCDCQVGGGPLDTLDNILIPLKFGRIAMINIAPFAIFSGSTPVNNIPLTLNELITDLNPYLFSEGNSSVLCGTCLISSASFPNGQLCNVFFGPASGNYILIYTQNGSNFPTNSSLVLNDSVIITYITNS